MILVFGSLNVDLVVPVVRLPVVGETVLGEGYRVAAGGKGANQALAARRAGADVRMVGAVGRDGFAPVALYDLAEAGVDLEGVTSVDAPTGAAFIGVDAEGRNQILVASGANRFASAEQVEESWLRPPGLLLLQMEVPLAENWALLKRARAAGLSTMLNVAPAGPLPEAVLPLIDWLVVNEVEVLAVAAAAGHRTQDPQRAGRLLADAGGAVLVTLGAKGAVAFAKGKVWRIEALPVDPLDTTGAGDAFVGTFAAALDSGNDLASAMAWASVAGSLACTVAGAQPSLPDRAAIVARIDEIAPAQCLSW
ncbi:ribokinase [Hypericibacter adhaerens]|uniref:Ribokinase n=1 Tax=Hypericibacter adhaerens TaxID=2602016 RepID=A0A5J6MXN3_9PROT|nr:ribokinase [Hypericibacter adhaerens]QEX22081.1 ribokinase [Hypericibacter adhaerens]